MKCNRFLFLSALMMLFITASEVKAQQKSISGCVYEHGNIPLPFATVIVKGESVGAQTDEQGNYVISGVKNGDILEFSYIGMKMVTHKVAASDFEGSLDVVLTPDNNFLEQVVVTGYGTSRKRDLTGSITSVSGEQIKTTPSGNVISGLQGKVPGLMVTNSGAAGAAPSIKIRGIGTLNASSNPLYIVDGMFLDDIAHVAPGDIESIEVLKDPSSLAAFGVQGANGVIIITTKRPSESRVLVSLDSYVGGQSVFSRDRVSLANADEFAMLYNEMLHNQNPKTPSWVPELLGEGTDWQSLLIRKSALLSSNNLKVAHSTDKSSTMLSIAYFHQDGVLKYNVYDRFNIRLSQEYKVSNNFRIGADVNLAKIGEVAPSADIQGAVLAIPNYQPYAPEKDHNIENPGSYYHPSPDIQTNVPNPVAVMELYKDTGKSNTYRIMGDAFAEIRFLKDFTLKATGYADYTLGDSWSYTPKYDVNNENSFSSHKTSKTSFGRESYVTKTYQADILLNYKKTLTDHRIDATVGFTARKSANEGFQASVDSLVNGMNVVPEDLRTLSMGAGINQHTTDWFSEYAFISYLARGSYAYKDRYLLTATLRADGSSKFAPSHRWGIFPSVGLGWVFSDEPFFNVSKDIVNFAKLRVSWGMLGNDKIGNYLYYPTIDPKGKQVVMNGEVVYIPTMKYEIDKNIHWEVMSGLDVGISAQMFRQRLNLEFVWYNKVTDDLLAYVSPSSSLGAGYAITNAGSIQNRGIEFSLDWNDHIGDFRYGVNVNGATLKNKVLSLGNNNADIISGDYHRTSVGEPIGSFYGYVQDGIFQNQQEIDSYHAMSWDVKPGDIRFKDVDDDRQITDKDRTFIGNPLPDFTYGFGLTFGWKGFDVVTEFNGVSGCEILDLKKTVAWTNVNYYEKHLARWHGEGTSTTEPIIDKSRGHNYLSSTNLLEDGSYLRLRSLQVGYTLPASFIRKMDISSVRFYINAQNLLTWRRNSGYTPEVGGGILDGGVDDGSTYPIPSVYTAGVSITF